MAYEPVGVWVSVHPSLLLEAHYARSLLHYHSGRESREPTWQVAVLAPPPSHFSYAVSATIS